MASKALKSPVFRRTAVRGLATSLEPAVKPNAISSKALGSVKATAYENQSPLTRVTVAFKAGSRYEQNSELGLTHVMRTAAGLTTAKLSTYLIQRKLAQLGALLTASTDREHFYYTLEATNTQIDAAIEIFCNAISQQEFRAWELEDILPRIKYDLAAIPPQVHAIDLLHRAAYRRGLGNSLFISPDAIGKISTEHLQHFYNHHMTPARCAIGVVGASLDRAQLVVNNMKLGEDRSSEVPASCYAGGEQRKETGGPLAHVAIACQGAPAGSPASLALAIAAKALGNGPVTKWGSDISPLARAVGNIGPFSAAGFNVSYSDTGLFGVVLSVHKDEANKAVSAVQKALKNPSSLTESDVLAGKNQLKLQILSEAEDGHSLSESLASQSLYSGNAMKPTDLAAAIDAVTPAAVIQAKNQVASGTLSMGAAGNLAYVPYLDEI